MVCFEHFSEDVFKRKDKYKVSLKPDAIPNIFNQTIQGENESCIDIVESIGHCGNYLQEDCCQCLQKDQKIATLTERNEKLSQINHENMKTIDDLRKKVKSIRDKSYYLESTNKRLKTATSSMKEQKLLNEKLSQSVQVLNNHKIAYRRIQRILPIIYFSLNRSSKIMNFYRFCIVVSRVVQNIQKRPGCSAFLFIIIVHADMSF